MKDEDLDLDLELELDPAEPPKRPQPAPAADAPKPQAAGVMAERRPGLFARVGSSVTGPLAQLGQTSWSYRNFLVLLVALVVLLVLGQNWAAVRIYLLGFRIEMPKALAFVLNMALGGLVTWAWLRRRQGHQGE